MGVLVCVLLGILFAVLPYLLWWNSLNGPYFIADYDETFYLAIAGQAYHNHPWSISDPATTEPQPSHYPVLQFAPAVVLAKTLHLGPQGVSVLWRIWAGFSMGVCFYLIYRANTRSVLLATSLTLLTFADIRVFSKPVVYTILTALKLALGRDEGYFTSDASLFPQWRIITPGVSFFGLLLYIWLIQRAVRQPSLGRIVAAGLALG